MCASVLHRRNADTRAEEGGGDGWIGGRSKIVKCVQSHQVGLATSCGLVSSGPVAGHRHTPPQYPYSPRRPWSPPPYPVVRGFFAVWRQEVVALVAVIPASSKRSQPPSRTDDGRADGETDGRVFGQVAVPCNF